jgi:hypothetical protein
MSQENVEAFKRAIEAANRQDVEGFLANCDPEVEWPRPAILMSLGGEAKAYRGHESVREVLRDVFEAPRPRRNSATSSISGTTGARAIANPAVCATGHRRSRPSLPSRQTVEQLAAWVGTSGDGDVRP